MTVEDFLTAPAGEAGGLAAAPLGGEHTLTLDGGAFAAPVAEDDSTVCAELRCTVGFDAQPPLTLTF